MVCSKVTKHGDVSAVSNVSMYLSKTQDSQRFKILLDMSRPTLGRGLDLKII